VRVVGRDREAPVAELGRDLRCHAGYERAQFVVEPCVQAPRRGRQRNRGVAARVRPHFAAECGAALSASLERHARSGTER
jgi:hypothetical protein